MSITGSARTKLQGVQVLRGLAALLVLWDHLKYNMGRDAGDFSNVPLLATDFGAIGVDIFFVISGFVISMTAAKMEGDWRAFLVSRLSRVVPLYFIVSTLFAVVAFSLNKPVDICGRTVVATYDFIPLLDGPNFTGPILTNGWTLSFEMWFYLCFAVLLRVGLDRRAWLWLSVFFVCGIAANMAFMQSASWYLPKFLFHPMTLEFCAGCILYHLRNRMGKSAMYVMGGFCLVFLLLGYDQSYLGVHWNIMNHVKAGLHRAAVWGGFAACLVGLMTQIDLKYSLKWPRFLLLLGDASYSIYLVPAVFMLIFEMAIVQLSKFAGHDLTPSPLWYGTIFVLGSVMAGIASWKFFELPATRLAKRFLLQFVPNKGKPDAPRASIQQIGDAVN